MPSLAIIGTGIAGMSAGYFLHKEYDLTVYEKDTYIGGHTNTVVVDEDGVEVPVDTGFMVFNHATYPLLTKLFAELDAPTMKTSMSFSVQHLPSGLEYCGSGLNGLFAQRKNIFSPRFIKMLMQISRFNKTCTEILDKPEYDSWSIEDYCRANKFGNDFIEKYLVPMSGAVWSTPPELMLKFPAVTLIRFFQNHGFLGLNTQHQWYTLPGGSRKYREKIIAPYRDKIRVANGAISVRREHTGGAIVRSKDGSEQRFDKVIFACHGDTALRLLTDPTPDEQRLLSCFRYQYNKATLHTDERVMPKTKLSWSSWNYRIEQEGTSLKPATIYWMNSLQQVSKKKNYFVSINDTGHLDPKKVLMEIDYEHPLFDVAAYQAQKELPKLNANGPIYFTGSYFRYGFHEDALLASVNLCSQLLGRNVL